jgi:hypothetical protein
MSEIREPFTGDVVTEENTAVAVASGEYAIDLSMLTDDSGKVMVCTLPKETLDQKIAVFNALQAPEHRLEKFVGKTILLTDYIAHVVQIPDENTGEIISVPRMVLIDKDGIGYECVSQGIFSSLTALVQIVGKAPWTASPLKVEPYNKPTRNGNNKILALKIVK